MSRQRLHIQVISKPRTPATAAPVRRWAEVRSLSTPGQVYMVTKHINDDSHYEYRCTCPWYTFHPVESCKHIRLFKQEEARL